MPRKRLAGHRQAAAGAADPDSGDTGPGTESESDSSSAARAQGRGQQRARVEVLCPGCRKGFPSIRALRRHRNNPNRQSTACGLAERGERRQRVMMRPAGAAAADDSDWTDPDIRDMMDPGNDRNVPAGAGRGEALPSRDRVSVYPARHVSRARALQLNGLDKVWTMFDVCLL